MDCVQSVLRRVAALTPFFLLTLVLATALPVHAQVAGTASIQGTVADPSAAVMANATVVLTNTATRVQRKATTDGSGLYSFPNIDIGTYDLTVTAQGFQTYTRTGIVLEVGSNTAINVPMKVGAADVKVEVQSEGLALQTEDVKFKQTIDQQDITEMPLNSNARQITGLLALSGGNTAAPGADFTGSKYTYQTIAVSIAGGQGNTTLWRLDGGDNNDYMANGNLPFPFPDAVAQFSVESTALGAQEGMHSGGLVNAVTRSGTNTYHGSAFEFIRNNFIDATNYFATTKDQLHQDQYGGTFGGRIIRDKLFAFAAYQRLWSKQLSSSTQAHVPTAANLAGDFSITDPAPGTTITGTSCSSKAVQLKDPLTGANLPGNKYTTVPSWNAQALALIKYLPQTSDPCGLVNYAIPQNVFDNQFITRVDWTISPKHNLFGRYFIDGFQQPAFFFPNNILVTTGSGNIERVQSFTMGEIYTINSNIINSAHATLLRRRNNRGYAASDINANALGITLSQGVPNGLQLTEGKFTIGGGTNSPAHFNDNTLAFEDEVTLVRGRHQIVFGGEFVRNQLNISNAYESNGVFTFNGQFSGSGPNGGSTIGDQSLDFLRGTLSAFQQSKFQGNALRGSIPSLYVQDTFHATPRLTAIAGVRWSPEFLPVDYFNRGTVFSMSAFINNQVSKIYPNAPAGALFYGDPGVPRQFTSNSPWQFSPNVGIAYDPTGTGRWVIRGGAELIYDEVNFFTSQREQQNPPYSTAISQTQTATSGPISFSAPWAVGSLSTSPFPRPAVPGPSEPFFTQSQFIVAPNHFRPMYVMQWTASVQHQFGHGWQMQLDYIGNKSTHVPLGLPLSPATYIPGTWGAGGTGCAGVVTTGPYAGKVGAVGSNCSTISNQAQRFVLTQLNPTAGNYYLGGGGGSVTVGDEGTANYNGLVTTAQHRLSSSFSLLTNWTWSKCLNEEDAQGDIAGTTVQNPNNPAGDYGPCGSDFRHVANVVLITKSNFHLPRAAALVVNNWEFAPLAHITSGAPFTVTMGTDVSLTAVGNDRPNVVPGVPMYINIAHRSGAGAVNRAYLNLAAFSAPAAGTYGTLGRNTLRGTNQYQFDAQISRIFPIHESLNMTARLEAFNVLNHPNFNIPTGGTTGTLGGTTGGAAALSSSTFGQISSTANTARVFQGSIKLQF
jgi:hypothetical protein